MQKVLQLISSGGLYGAERVVLALSIELRKMGFVPIVAAFRNDFNPHTEILDQASSLGLQTEVISCSGQLDRKAVAHIQEILRRESIGIIHSHGVKSNLYGWLAGRGGVAKLVSTCHTWHITGAKAWASSVFDRWLLCHFDHVVLVSAHMARQVRPFGIRAVIVDNGIDLKPFLEGRAVLRQELGWGNRPVVAAVGRLAPEKGLPNLMVAAAELIKENPEIQFVLAGDGPLREPLQLQARDLGIGNRVSFLGVRRDIPELLASIDVLALPSFSEGLPMTLLEAMAAGRPVVASKVGAIPGVVEDEVTGLLICPGDVPGLVARLRRLLGDASLRLKLGAAARQQVLTRYSASVMARRYSQLYQGMTSQEMGVI